MSNEIPKPASPLPWALEVYKHEGLACHDLRGADGEEVVGIVSDDAPVWARPDFVKSDADYIVWAANNALKLAERIEQLEARLLPAGNGTDYIDHYKARIEQLEAALREIADSKYCLYETNGTGQYAAGITDGHRYCAKIARKALE